MRKPFTPEEVAFIEEHSEFLSSEDLSAVLDRPVRAVRVKLTRMSTKFHPDNLICNRVKDVSIKESNGKVLVNVSKFKGALKVIIF